MALSRLPPARAGGLLTQRRRFTHQQSALRRGVGSCSRSRAPGYFVGSRKISTVNPPGSCSTRMGGPNVAATLSAFT